MLIPLPGVPAAAESETLLYSYTFDNEAAESEFWAPNGSAAEIEWFTGPSAGFNDDTALRVTNNGSTFNSAENAVRLTLPEPLPPGGVYRIVAWCFAALDENPDKTVLTGPGFVINGDYPGAQGVVKFPPDFGNLPFDEWKKIDVTLPLQSQAINTLDFRIVINDAPNHPDIWYWDSIEIYQVGELEHIRVPEWDLSLPSLAGTYKDLFLIGNATDSYRMDNPETAAMFKHHYNLVTAENSMKPLYIAPSEDEFNFGGADQLVNWALENGIAVHGHTLIWHSQTAGWLTSNSDGILTREEARSNMELYISKTAGHFAGRVASWDVVNEAFTDNVSEGTAWQNALRTDSPWYRAYDNGADSGAGEHASDYIYDAFVFARLADPGSVLYYNDFNEEFAGKRKAMASMAVELNEKWKADPRNTEPDRLLIEGLGMQAHYWTEQLDVADVRATILEFIEAGVRISISELDIPFGDYGNYRNRTTAPSEAELAEQAKLYGDLFKVFVAYADHIDRVTFWGLSDDVSWRSLGYPLLFDDYYEAKPAFFSVLDAASWRPPEAPAASPQSPAASPAIVETPLPEPHESGGGGAVLWIVIIIAVIGIGAGVFVYLRIRKNNISS